ncbi:hypothetical protein EYF80_044646 [Liparis tanakae]|uniref:Uncharacterized protein n=1 Tax=Liparis tanakae TaxID=230148 RepID=A0A4Z2FW63_9TELE|nr:hypothetical protein EYF80_044646 [Liparis tanakae]
MFSSLPLSVVISALSRIQPSSTPVTSGWSPIDKDKDIAQFRSYAVALRMRMEADASGLIAGVVRVFSTRGLRRACSRYRNNASRRHAAHRSGEELQPGEGASLLGRVRSVHHLRQHQEDPRHQEQEEVEEEQGLEEQEVGEDAGAEAPAHSLQRQLPRLEGVQEGQPAPRMLGLAEREKSRMAGRLCLRLRSCMVLL